MSADTDTNCSPSSVANIPTDTAVTMTFNRVDDNGTLQQNWESAVAVVSGGALNNMIRAVEGTAQAWPAGTVVEILWNSDTWNDAIDGILVGHTQLGAHNFTTLFDANGNEIFKTTAAGGAINEVTLGNAAAGNNPFLQATGGDNNVGLNLISKGTGEIQINGVGLEPIVEDWTTWAPTYGAETGTFTSVTTTYARYKQVGKTVFLEIRASGTTSGSTAFLTFTLPVNAQNHGAQSGRGGGIAIVGGGYGPTCSAEFSATGVCRVIQAAGANWTATTGQGFGISLIYEAN